MVKINVSSSKIQKKNLNQAFHFLFAIFCEMKEGLIDNENEGQIVFFGNMYIYRYNILGQLR